MSVNSRIDNAYEERVRSTLPGQLFQVLGMGVIEPAHGFNRKVTKVDYSSHFIDKTYDNIEIDFIAHTNFVAVPSLHVNKLGPHLTFTLSENKRHSPFQRKRKLLEAISPEKPIELPVAEGTVVEPSQLYVIAEITHGSRRTLEAKIEQLERDCKYVADRGGLSEGESILEVVALLVVVGVDDLCEKLFHFVRNSSFIYPYVTELFNAGRFLHVRNQETTSRLLEDTCNELAETRKEIAETNLKLESLEVNFSQMEANFSQMKSTLDTILVLLQNKK